MPAIAALVEQVRHVLPVEAKVFRGDRSGSQAGVDLRPAHMSSEGIAHDGTELSSFWAIRVPPFRFENSVGEVLIGQGAGLRDELIDVKGLAIDDGATEPKADAYVFQQLIVGGAHNSTVAERPMSAMGRKQTVAPSPEPDISAQADELTFRTSVTGG